MNGTEEDVHHRLNMTNLNLNIDKTESILMQEQIEEEMKLVNESVEIDLSTLRGIQPPSLPTKEEERQKVKHNHNNMNNNGIHEDEEDDETGMKKLNNLEMDKNSDKLDLEALSELVPGLKTGQIGAMAVNQFHPDDDPLLREVGLVNSMDGATTQNIPHLDSMVVNQGIDGELDDDNKSPIHKMDTLKEGEEEGDDDDDDDDDDTSDVSDDRNRNGTGGGGGNSTNELIKTYQSKRNINGEHEESDSSDSKSTAAKTNYSDDDNRNLISPTKDYAEGLLPPTPASAAVKAASAAAAAERDVPDEEGVEVVASLTPGRTHHINNTHNNTTQRDNYSEQLYSHQELSPPPGGGGLDESMYGSTPNPRQEFNHQSSVASISTATQTQSNEMRMPMFLPNFRPATGCTNASDFIVRCFAARLRSGITVVKHGRSRWCKSRLRILHVHSDGRSLSWKPAQGEPSSSKRPPKLDLSTCLEVRHAWSPDPLNPMFTGTPILRSKCEASNAFKSFALIFPKRTVDITAVTADQCKVLMEGFSALCFRLQVANMAGRGNRPDGVSMMNDESGGSRGVGKLEGTTTATTHSVTNT